MSNPQNDQAMSEDKRKKLISERRVARVVQRNSSPTDAQLGEMFSGKKSPSVPEEDFSWSDLISANTGKTIKPIEKWL